MARPGAARPPSVSSSQPSTAKSCTWSIAIRYHYYYIWLILTDQGQLPSGTIINIWWILLSMVNCHQVIILLHMMIFLRLDYRPWSIAIRYEYYYTLCILLSSMVNCHPLLLLLYMADEGLSVFFTFLPLNIINTPRLRIQFCQFSSLFCPQLYTAHRDLCQISSHFSPQYTQHTETSDFLGGLRPVRGKEGSGPALREHILEFLRANMRYMRWNVGQIFGV